MLASSGRSIRRLSSRWLETRGTSWSRPSATSTPMNRPRKTASTPLRSGFGEARSLRRRGALGDAEVGAGGGERDAELGQALLDRLLLRSRRPWCRAAGSAPRAGWRARPRAGASRPRPARPRTSARPRWRSSPPLAGRRPCAVTKIRLASGSTLDSTFSYERVERLARQLAGGGVEHVGGEQQLADRRQLARDDAHVDALERRPC